MRRESKCFLAFFGKFFNFGAKLRFFTSVPFEEALTCIAGAKKSCPKSGQLLNVNY